MKEHNWLGNEHEGSNIKAHADGTLEFEANEKIKEAKGMKEQTLTVEEAMELPLKDFGLIINWDHDCDGYAISNDKFIFAQLKNLCPHIKIAPKKRAITNLAISEFYVKHKRYPQAKFTCDKTSTSRGGRLISLTDEEIIEQFMDSIGECYDMCEIIDEDWPDA